MADPSTRLGALLGVDGDSDSRWNPNRRLELLRTPDRLGDGLVSRFWRVCDFLATSKDLDAFLEAAATFIAPIVEYERESRSILQLAHTGLAMELVERAHRWVDLMSREKGVPDAVSGESEWRDELMQERRERAAEYQRVLGDGNAQRDLVVREEDVTEAQTLLSYGYSTYANRLLDEEQSVILAAFNWLALVSGVVIINVPAWFTSPLEIERRQENVWRGADVSVLEAPTHETEESFLNQVALWKTFNHPNIAKLFAASHIGRRCFIFTLGVANEDGLCSWSSIYQCAQALQYLYHCGVAHRRFSRDLILLSPHKTILLGCQVVVQRKESNGIFAVVNRFMSKMFSSQRPETDADPPSLETSMKILAQISLAVMHKKKCAEMDGFDPKHVLSGSHRPSFLSTLEWSAFQAMSALTSSDRTAFQHVNLQLEALVDACDDSEVEDASSDNTELLRDTIALAATGQTFQDVFDALETFFTSGSHKATESFDRSIYMRLSDVYNQIRDRRYSALPAPLVTKFRAVVARYFHSTVTSSALSCSSVVASLAVRSLAGPDYSYHREIDRLLGFRDVNDRSRVHGWLRQSSLGDDEEDITTSRFDRFDFSSPSATFSTSPMSRRPNRARKKPEKVNEFYESGRVSTSSVGKKYPPSSRARQRQVANHLPVWYIRSHEIELGDFIAQGSYGAVYRGKWYNTDVVIKMIIGNMSPHQRLAFKREADIWYALEHPNVIQLYGACHTGSRSFFVCELAEGGTLTEYLREGRPYLWRCIREAAVGLQYLHDRGIVHSDLKGNNILVGSDFSVKLADFGLSQLESQGNELEQNSSDDESSGALGAYRWKAPEILNGGRPTSASDVFSFAMCIVECVSGEVPWGTNMPDLVVKVNVKRGRLPTRPNGFRDDEWELVTRMLSLYPSERVSMRLVVETLDQFRDRTPLPV